jgi:hypothetical protein
MRSGYSFLMWKSAVLLCLALLVLPAAYAASGLHYSIPDGWVDVSDPTVSTSGIPEFIVREARSGKYVIYAVDPANTSEQGALVSFNVIEQAGKGRIIQAMVDQTAAEVEKSVAATGLTLKVTDRRMAKLGTVDIGVVEAVMNTPRGQLQLVQYLIPGKTHVAVLTYDCPVALRERYKPIFEASAMATTGTYSHSLFNFKQLALFGLFGAIIAGTIAAVVAGSSKKKRKGPAPSIYASPTMWDCPTCKRRVPVRLDACRCGAARPA